MHPSVHAQTTPDKAAIIMAQTGETMSYRQLDARSNQAAQLFRSIGLQIGDVVALMLDNSADFLALAWGAQRAGLINVCMSTRATADEAGYILENSGAKAFIASARLGAAVTGLGTPLHRYSHGGPLAGFQLLEPALAAKPATRIADERAGIDMLYSSGTTGRPKGVRFPLPEDPAIAPATDTLTSVAAGLFRLNANSTYLSTAPLYHAAPLRWSMTVHRLGGTVVVMEKFDAEAALAAIERYRVTSSQWVPTHFVRLLKLPDDLRRRYDLSSLTCAIHAAAPCPVPVKQAMIDWWGPILEEYYSGTEGAGFTYINSHDWQTHKGSVGRAVTGAVHIVGEDNETELPVGMEGSIFFESTSNFAYHDDAEKTAATYNSKGWATLGDVGRLDEDGFLYLTDRKSFMIISGGVNIYPQEIENHLITHPKVQDVAVIGGPHPEMGEEVIAVVQPVTMADAGDALREELMAFARTKLSGIKAPRRIDFLAELPRHDTGKLYKRLLRDQYWASNAGPA